MCKNFVFSLNDSHHNHILSLKWLQLIVIWPSFKSKLVYFYREGRMKRSFGYQS